MPSSFADDGSYKGCLPSDFVHGYASASYQIEGGWNEGGRLPTIWDDMLNDRPANGKDAVDSFHLWKDDVELLKQYGSNAYRFSVCWARIKPLGGKDDPVNEEGIAYYSNLIDALLAANIQPWITIYHWDLPSELEKRYGGFTSENQQDIVEDFVAYAKVLFERFGDRVKNWITINEPHIYSMLNSLGLKKDFELETSTWKLGHRLILCHAHTVDLYRREFQPKQKGTIGITLDCDWTEPFDDSEEAKKAAFITVDKVMGWFADPIYHGKLNDTWKQEVGDKLEDFTPEEWKLIKGSSEFFGLNSYGTGWATGKILEPGKMSPMAFFFGGTEVVRQKDGKDIGLKGHNGHPYCVPWGFRKLLNYISKRYTKDLGIPICITENGFPIENESQRSFEQIIDDKERQTYYDGYIQAVCDAVKEDGVNIHSYFGWSLLDNLEWVFGYEPRFGVTYVDRENGFKRTPKDSTKMIKSIFETAVSKS